MNTEAAVLLVNAPYPRHLKFPGQPTSLLYAVADTVEWAEREYGTGSVRLMNYNLTPPAEFRARGLDHFVRLLHEVRPRVVAVSTTTASLPIARQLAAAAKQTGGRPLVVFGGAHEDDAEDAAKTALWDPNVDLSVAGDGESALRGITEVAHQYAWRSGGDVVNRVQEWAARRRTAPELYGSARVFARGLGDHGPPPTAAVLTAGPFARTLDELPFAPRRLLACEERGHYPVFRRPDDSVKPTAQVMTARGCIRHCDFCSESGRLNERTAAGVTRELEELRAAGYEAVFFDDSTMTNRSTKRRQFLRDVGDALQSLKLEWGCQTRVDSVDRQLLWDMAERGCTYIYFGVESFVPHLLAALNKGYTPDRIEQTLRDCHALDIRVGASLLLGAPDENERSLETLDTARHTFRKVREYADRGPIRLVSLNLFAYYPGTASTNRLAVHHADVKTAGYYDRFETNDEFPFSLLEEHSPYTPAGLRDNARDILLLASDMLGDLLSGSDVKHEYPGPTLE